MADQYAMVDAGDLVDHIGELVGLLVLGELEPQVFDVLAVLLDRLLDLGTDAAAAAAMAQSLLEVVRDRGERGVPRIAQEHRGHPPREELDLVDVEAHRGE